jgi:hypothetical protein
MLTKQENEKADKPEATIPGQFTGHSNDNMYEITASGDAEAESLYTSAVARLLNINDWGKIAGLVSAAFQLTDAGGNEVQRTVWENDFIRIDIPGPGSTAGEGYDWVRVERIDESEDHECNTAYVSITVRPSPSPTNDQPDTAHFFDEKATSTFIVRKDRNRVIAEIHGRNEESNRNTASKLDKLRNTVIAESAKSGFSDIQWKNLAKGLVSPA